MDIIFLAEDGRQRLQLALPRLAILAGLAALAVAAAFYGGIKYGIDSVRVPPTGAVHLWQRDLALQEANVKTAIEGAQDDLNALARRLGELQARADRLDALGSRLVTEAHIDPAEMSFDEVPGIGGEEPRQSTDYDVHDFLAELRELEARLEDRQPKLEVLSAALMNRDLQRRVRPSVRPVASGWVSSHYGYRPDPITGRREFHRGVDIAGANGTEVLAAADGVVVEAGVRSGYGKTIKIAHANGFATRYAHNSKNLVAVGDVVHRGQRIALMGHTGRTTGPHVHYEVYLDGKPVDPKAFLQASR